MKIISIGKEVNIATFLDKYYTRKSIAINEFGAIQICDYSYSTETATLLNGETISFFQKHYFIFSKEQIIVSYSLTELLEYILERRKEMNV